MPFPIEHDVGLLAPMKIYEDPALSLSQPKITKDAVGNWVDSLIKSYKHNKKH